VTGLENLEKSENLNNGQEIVDENSEFCVGILINNG